MEDTKQYSSNYNKEWYEANKEKVRASDRKYSNKRYQEDPEYREMRKAQSKARRLNNPEAVKEGQRKWREEEKIANPIKQWLRGVKVRATTRGFEFSITEADLVYPITCPVYGMPLRYFSERIMATRNGENDDIATVDRYDSSKEYVPGNVYIISWKAYELKKNTTLEDLQLLVKYMEKISQP